MRLIFWMMFAVMLGVYLVMVLWSLPLLMADAGGLPVFDLRPMGYSFDEAQAFLAALSPEGRVFYLDVQQWLDTAYPALLGVTLVMAFRFLFRGALRWVAIAFALAGTVFDYLENAAVAGMLRAGSEGITPDMVATASRWTLLKSGAVTLAMLMLIAGLAMLVWRKVGRKT